VPLKDLLSFHPEHFAVLLMIVPIKQKAADRSFSVQRIAVIYPYPLHRKLHFIKDCSNYNFIRRLSMDHKKYSVHHTSIHLLDVLRNRSLLSENQTGACLTRKAILDNHQTKDISYRIQASMETKSKGPAV